MNDLVFLHGNRNDRCDARVDKRFDGYHTLQFMEAGSGSGGVEVWYDETRHALNDGSAWFWPAFPGPRIRFHSAPGRDFWRHRYIAFQGPRVLRWVADGVWLPGPQTAPTTPNNDHAARFDLLHQLVLRTDPVGQARAVHLLEGLLLELADARGSACVPPTRPAPAFLQAVLDAINAPGGETVDYEMLAASQNMALSTLRRKFKGATGTPLHDYVLQTRLVRARHLLGETDLPIKAIAEQLGYRDVYFFTRQFRSVVGVPPGAYRKSRL